MREGELFFCVSGFDSDGHDFAPQAVAAGAAALVVERPLELGVPEVTVASTRAAMAPLAARFFGDPTSELRVVGVTGTNGKTTTAYLLRALLEAAGEQCGLLGTVKSVIGGGERAVTRTTPEAIDLQASFREMLDGGDRACAMEVSSHALALGRAEAIHFAAAVFTNLTQDHLDFHDTMEDYFQAKRRLFAEQAPGVSIVNSGDPYGRRLAGEIDGARTFAVEAPGDYSATGLRCDFAGCSFTLRTPAGERAVALPVPGRFNVENALAALATAHRSAAIWTCWWRRSSAACGFRDVSSRWRRDRTSRCWSTTRTRRTRWRTCCARRANWRSAGMRERGRVLCVFGAGGDRDRGKRPQMGEIATRLADVVVVTSDNPRSEDPEQIIAEIMAGVARAGGAELPSGADGAPAARSIADRRQAIGEAIANARSGDVVVIAGKGHEHGQEFEGGRKEPFDDVAVAAEALRARERRRASAELSA